MVFQTPVTREQYRAQLFADWKTDASHGNSMEYQQFVTMMTTVCRCDALLFRALADSAVTPVDAACVTMGKPKQPITVCGILEDSSR